MNRKITPALAIAALLIASSPQLFARDDRGPATGTMPDATSPSGSRPSTDRDAATSPSYDRLDDSGTARDKKLRKSKERNPNAATPAVPATPASPETGMPAQPATPASPSSRETTP